ncbi:hypothetical protein EOPP23_10215 [Endozoicomonas sp. OPT23]|nr:hypothetical protein [Endozoicomonas sp. OPT23]
MPSNLEDNLGHIVVNSSISDLSHHLLHTPCKDDSSSWQGSAEAVAMADMLGQSILVLQLNSSFQIIPESILINSSGAFSVYSPQFASQPMPEHQLVLFEGMWFALQAEPETPEDTWTSGIQNYLQQLQQLLSVHTSGLGEELIQLPDIQLEISNNSSVILHQLQFLRQSCKRLADIQMGVSELSPTAVDCCVLEQLLNLVSQITDQINILLNPICSATLTSALANYLEAHSIEQQTLCTQIISMQNSAETVIKIILRLLQNTESTNSQCREIVASSQDTKTNKHPSSQIMIHTGGMTFEFDQNNSVHHILGSLHYASLVFELVTNLLNSCALSPLEDAELNKAIHSIQSIRGFKRLAISTEGAVPDRLQPLNQIITEASERLHVLIHALGRRYFPDQWQNTSYVPITIALGLFIIFHSDNFVPRGGWRDSQ